MTFEKDQIKAPLMLTISCRSLSHIIQLKVESVEMIIWSKIIINYKAIIQTG